MSWQILIEFLGLLPVFIVVGLMTWQKRHIEADDRREAITTDLRNHPARACRRNVTRSTNYRWIAWWRPSLLACSRQ